MNFIKKLMASIINLNNKKGKIYKKYFMRQLVKELRVDYETMVCYIGDY